MSRRTLTQARPDSVLPPELPNLKLIERIGGGAHGEVWRAEAFAAATRAVKIVRRASFSDPRPYEREFAGVRLAEPVSRDHPALMDVLFVGEEADGGGFFCVMELADPLPGVKDGAADYRPRTLRAEIRRRGRLAVAEVLDLGVALAEGLAFLHGRGLLHRDLKPANVIYVGGQPKLADIGLVTSRDTAESLVGTEGYLPPEGPGTVSADLFAFGRMLYEASTGRRAEDFPSVPEDLAGWPDREAWLRLNRVLARACAPRPADRFPDAEALLVALRAVRDGGTPAGLSRRRWVLGGSALAAAALGGWWWFGARRPGRSQLAPGDQRAAVLRGHMPAERAAWAREFIPPRPPGLPEGPVDLTAFYNASLIRSPFPGDTDLEAESNSLAALPSGLQVWFDTPFDVRGMIQLDSREVRRRFGRLLPVAVRGIPVGRKFQRLQVIHGASWPAPVGEEIARYRIRYTGGDNEIVAIRFGYEIHGSWRRLDEPISAPPAARIVWRGYNPMARRAGHALVFYLMTWDNPRVDQVAETLDLESTMTDSSVGVVAITAA